MTSRDADSRAETLDSLPEGSQRNWREEGLGASNVTATRAHSGAEAVEQLIEAVVERKNMWLALKQVERNSGAAGVDNMTVAELRTYLREHWPRIKPTLIVVDFCHCWTNVDASSLLYEPPYTEPYVRWCGRTAEVTPPPTRSF